MILFKLNGSAKKAAASWEVLRTSLLIRVPEYSGAGNYYGAWRKGIDNHINYASFCEQFQEHNKGQRRKVLFHGMFYRGAAEILSSFPAFPSVKMKKPH